MKDTMNFIRALASASTADLVTKLQPDAFHQLHVPPNGPLVVSSPGIRHSISTYLVLKHSSQAAYEAVTHSLKPTSLTFQG